MSRQLALFDRPHTRTGAGRFERYGPWPAPDGFYSHFVVWKTCLWWEFVDWLNARRGAA